MRKKTLTMIYSQLKAHTDTGSRLFKVFAGIWYMVLVSVFILGFVRLEREARLHQWTKADMQMQLTVQQSIRANRAARAEISIQTGEQAMSQNMPSDPSRLDALVEPNNSEILLPDNKDAGTATNLKLTRMLQHQVKLDDLWMQEQRKTFSIPFLPWLFPPLVILFSMQLLRHVTGRFFPKEG
jgi:hypothetical protein